MVCILIRVLQRLKFDKGRRLGAVNDGDEDEDDEDEDDDEEDDEQTTTVGFDLC
jgi:hypothetical protein